MTTEDKMSPFAETIYLQKYAKEKEDGTKECWAETAERVAKNVLKSVNAKKSLIKEVERIIAQGKFIPGGRYLYASGRQYHQVNNCLLMKAKDSREGWAEILHNASMALMTGAGIGIDYSDIRAEGKLIRKTGGYSTGPLALMQMVNDCGRGIMQGGARRCLSEDTQVLMNTENWKNIQDICPGEKIKFNNEEVEVLANYSNGKQEIVKIELDDGTFFECTEEHRWYVFNHKTNDFEWILTKDLNNGEYSMIDPT